METLQYIEIQQIPVDKNSVDLLAHTEKQQHINATVCLMLLHQLVST